MLPTGEVEVLLTTLLDTKRFKAWLFLRNIPQTLGHRNLLPRHQILSGITNFSAYTVNNCWQDIYAHFINYNIQTVYSRQRREIKKVNKQRQHDYKAQPERHRRAAQTLPC